MRTWRFLLLHQIVLQKKTANNFTAETSLENEWMCHRDLSVEEAPKSLS